MDENQHERGQLIDQAESDYARSVREKWDVISAFEVKVKSKMLQGKSLRPELDDLIATLTNAWTDLEPLMRGKKTRYDFPSFEKYRKEHYLLYDDLNIVWDFVSAIREAMNLLGIDKIQLVNP